jgi:hypothetical protein
MENAMAEERKARAAHLSKNEQAIKVLTGKGMAPN